MLKYHKLEIAREFHPRIKVILIVGIKLTKYFPAKFG
jgi:hypothetical protein